MLIGVFLYSISLIAQTVAAIYALNLFFRAKAYRLACGSLAIGLCLMVGRRISPIFHLINGAHLNLSDALLSVPISLLLLFGMFQFRRLLIDLEEKSFILDQFSKLDSLTGATSRPETFARAQIEIERSFRSRQCISFLMMDIDHFKNVNDTYGHPAGDIALTNLVKRCQEELRSVDILGRVGGEEFLIVLPEINTDQAFEVAERVRKKVAENPCATWGEHEISITISVGIAVFDPSKDKNRVPKAIIQKYYEVCDHAMYRAKSAGRNQVCVERSS